MQKVESYDIAVVLGKRVRKAKSSMPNKYSQKEGGTTAIFKFRILHSFSLLDSGNHEMCHFKDPGGRIEAATD